MVRVVERCCWLAVLAVAACRDGAGRTAVVHGVQVTTTLPDPLAVIVVGHDGGGRQLVNAYALLGRSAGTVAIGEPPPDGTRLHLQLGVAAELWLEQQGRQLRIEGTELAGLCGANVDGTLALRGARHTFSSPVAAGQQVVVRYAGDTLHVDLK